MIFTACQSCSTRDRETARERGLFARARRAETSYARALRGVARAVGHIVSGFRHGEPGAEAEIAETLRQYGQLIRPWARTQAERMLHDVSRRDEAAWRELAKTMGRHLREEIASAPTGERMRQLLEEQVHYITSLPIDAAIRVQQIATGQLYSGARPDELRDQILRTGHVTKSRAELIARTETSRASTTLTRARAEHVGSEGYVWRTAGDYDVRPEHRKLNGKFVRWDDPPVAGSRGERAHAGEIYNCRCWAEPVIPDEQPRRLRRAA